MAGFGNRHGEASERGNPRRFEPRHTTTDHGDATTVADAVRRLGLVLRLVPGTGIDDARDDRVAVVSHLACLIAQQARSYARVLTGTEPGHEIGVGQLRPRHLDGVRRPTVDGPLGLPPLDDRALRDHGYGRSGFS